MATHRIPFTPVHTRSDEPRAAHVVDQAPRQGSKTSIATPFFVLSLVAGIATWRLLVGRGIPLLGDFVPVSRAYVNQALSLWDLHQHGGTLNYNLNQAPWLAPLAYLAGGLGSWSFVVINRLFILSAIISPMFSAAGGAMLLSSVTGYRRSAIAVACGVSYGLSPWCAAQDASGHFTTVLAYCLLPLVLTTSHLGWSKRSAVLLGGLEALICSLDLHIALVAGLVAGIGAVLGPGRNVLWRLGVALVTAVGGCLYWLVPNVLTLRELPAGLSIGTAGQVPVRTVAELARLDTFWNLIGGRSFWWRPFTNGLYGVGHNMWLLPAGLDIGALSLVLLAINAGDWQVLVLTSLGVVPPFVAHLHPGVYLLALHLPGGGFFLDPSTWTPFYLLGIWRALCREPDRLSARRVGGKHERFRSRNVVRTAITVTGAAVLCVGTLTPWVGGDLRGRLRLANVSDGEISATHWLNRRDHRGLALWLPTVPYISVPWASGQINDPARSWAQFRVANTYTPSYYDSSPAYNAALLDFQALLSESSSEGFDLALTRRYLAATLAQADVRFVVARFASLGAEAVQVRALLSSSAGLVAVARFRSTWVFRVEGRRVATATLAQAPTIVEPGWQGEIDALQGTGRHLPPVTVPLYQAHLASLMGQATGSPIRVAELWDAVFGQHRPRDGYVATAHQTYMFDGVQGLGEEQGSYIKFGARGVAAAWVVAGRGGATLGCLGSRTTEGIGRSLLGALYNVTGREGLLVDEQPTVTARWIATPCTGIAILRFATRNGPSWLLGTTTMSGHQFSSTVYQVEKRLASPGSGYTMAADDLTGTGHYGVQATYRQNPLFLTGSTVRIEVPVSPFCHPTTAAFVEERTGSTLVRAALAMKHGEFAGAAEPPRGTYQVFLFHDATSCAGLVVSPTNSGRHVHLSATVAPKIGSRARYGQSEGVLYAGAPGPWTVSVGKHVVPPFTANQFETLYPTDGKAAKVSAGQLALLPRWLLVSYVGVIGALVLLLQAWRRSGTDGCHGSLHAGDGPPA